MRDSQAVALPGRSRSVRRYGPSFLFVVRLLGSLLTLSSALQAKEPKGREANGQRLFESEVALDVVLRLPWQTIVTDELFCQGGYPSVLEVAGGQAQRTGKAEAAHGQAGAVGAARVFQGFCAHNAGLGDARQVFLDRETEILSLVENESRLTEAAKARTVIFLGQFFEILKNPEEFSTQVTSNCRN